MSPLDMTKKVDVYQTSLWRDATYSKPCSKLPIFFLEAILVSIKERIRLTHLQEWKSLTKIIWKDEKTWLKSNCTSLWTSTCLSIHVCPQYMKCACFQGWFQAFFWGDVASKTITFPLPFPEAANLQRMHPLVRCLPCCQLDTCNALGLFVGFDLEDEKTTAQVSSCKMLQIGWYITYNSTHRGYNNPS